MQTVWLASYPKSGNTWVRFLLYALMFGPPEKSIDVSKRIPDVHRPLPFDRPASGPMYAKTHFELTDRHPALATTARAVHVVRHPKDVLLSALHYKRLSGKDEKKLPAEAFAREFLARAGDPAWANQGFGTWATHTTSWADNARFPVLSVRYEDLKADTPAALARIARFLEIEPDADAVARAVDASSFDALRALEVREKAIRTKNPNKERLFVGDQSAARKGVYFINAGKTGQSLDSLAPGLDDAFAQTFAVAHGDLLERFGYSA